MLEGSLETFPLTSVVRMLDDAGQTGRLSVHAALGQGSITFERGRLVNASGPGPDPLEAALALFEHRTGTFTFRVESVAERELDVDIPQFLDLVEEREAAWAEIRQAIPQDGPLVVAPLDVSDRPDGEVTVSNEAWKVALLANGRTTAQMASLAGTTEFRACSVLLELHAAGLIGFNTTAQGGRPVKKNAAVVAEEPFEAPEPDEAPEIETEIHDDAELDPEALLRELGESPAPAQASRRRLSRR